MKIHRKALSRIYKQNNVRFKSAKYHFALPRNVTKEEKQREQEKFVLQHVSWLEDERDILYFDESSCNLWQKRLKVWRTVDAPLPCYLQPQQGGNVTMLGAVSTKSDRAYVQVAAKTNKEHVLAFFEQYLQDHRGAILVMDNHKAHRGYELRSLCEEYGITMAFLPSNSSQLNPVERLWSLVKAKWANHLLDHRVTPVQAADILFGIIQQIPPASIEGVLRSSHRMMTQVMDGHLI